MGYHLTTPFLPDQQVVGASGNSSVIAPEQSSDITINAAYMFAYAAQPCGPLQIPAEPGLGRRSFRRRPETAKRRAEAHETGPDETRGGSGSGKWRPSAPGTTAFAPSVARHVVIGIADNSRRPDQGQHRDRKSGRQRDQERGWRSSSTGKVEERDRQPRRLPAAGPMNRSTGCTQ